MSLPLFYFRPTLCWVDDDPLFLAAVSDLYTDKNPCLSFTNPEVALNFLRSYQAPLSTLSFTRDFVESDVFGTADHLPVDLNISAIRNVAQLAERRQEIAVLIIDYNMPGMNGLEVCKHLKDLPVKKILLTGETSLDKAIEAFNLGIIDKFLQKEADLEVKLQEYIDELSQEYFHNKTANLIAHIEASKAAAISDPVFIDFFNAWRASKQITEFYLSSKEGSFLVKNLEGRESSFVVMSETDKDSFLRLNDENSASVQELLKQVALGACIPYFGPKQEAWQVDCNAWPAHFYPAQTIQGREKYYWTVVEHSI